ncbi:MAG TPA: polysaccharide biosynthesis tyrosine autokinase [Acidimicrobiales bacterium]
MLPQVEPTDELELRDYLRVLRRRKWTVLLTVVLVVAAALAVSFVQTPVYRASAELLLQPRSTESIFDPSVVRTFAEGKQAPTEIRVVKSDPVRAIVREQIGNAPAISASNPAETDFIIVSAEHADPERAAEIANAYGTAYAEYRRRQAVSDLEKASADLQVQIDELARQIDAATAAAAATRSQPAATSEATAVLVQQRNLYTTRLDQLRLAMTQKTGGVQVVSPAVAPSEPVRPTPARNAAVALVVGLLLGVGLAFLRDYLDDSLTAKEDVERTLPGTSVLAMIPEVTTWKNRDAPYVTSVEEPTSPAAEAYRSLRTSVQFMGVERRLQIVQVTSPSATEGKSTTIANLGVALAGAGQRVVIVCCDLRRPRIHEFFDLHNRVGLTSVLIGDAPLSSAIQPVPRVENLYLMASGPIPPNPSELLGGSHTADVFETLRSICDVILVDCPPVLPVTDAAVLARKVDGVLLVATAGDTGQKQLRRAAEILHQVDAPVLGVVLNGVTDAEGYGYGYGYQYTPTPQKKADKKKAARRSGEAVRV